MSRLVCWLRLGLECLIILVLGAIAIILSQVYAAYRTSGSTLSLAIIVVIIFAIVSLTVWRGRAWIRYLRDRSALSGSNPRFTWLPVYAVLLVGLVMTGGLTKWMANGLKKSAQSQFGRLNDRMESEIRRRITRYVDGLKGARGIFIASEKIEREEFRHYFDSRELSGEFPGALGLGFVERVRQSDVSGFVAEMKAFFDPDYQVEMTKSGDDLLLVKFIEPLDTNRAMWGKDLGREPNLRHAAERAMRTGEASISGRVRIETCDGELNGQVYFLPVYRVGNDAPDTEPERLDRLIGWTIMPVTIRGALANITATVDGALDVDVFDSQFTTSESILYDADGHLAEVRGPVDDRHYASRQFKRNFNLDVGGRTWNLWISSTPRFDSSIDENHVGLAAIAGCGMTFLLAVLVHTLGSSRMRAMQLAESMTADLATSKNDAEAALREMTTLQDGLDQHSIISVTDPRGTIIDVNRGFIEISGYSRHELIGQNHRIVNSGYHTRQFWKEIWQTIASGTPWRGEVCNRRKDGSVYWVDSTIVPFFDKIGEIEKYVAIRFDITEKKAADEEKARLVAIVTSTEDAILSTTIDGKVATWNDGAQTLFGYSAEEAIGRDANFIIPESIRDDETTILTAILQGDKAQHFETKRLRRNGAVTDVSVTISPIRDAAGAVIGTSSIARDISDRKRIESMLIEAQMRAESANRSKSEFLANMSHEIRTPMTAILGFADLLTDSEVDPVARKRHVETIRRNGTHLLSIINDILDLSKIEAKKMSLERSIVNPISIIQDVAALMAVKAEAQGLELKVVYESAIPDLIMTDAMRLRQILVNLVGNAIKFTEVGGVSIRVFYNKESKGSLQIAIEDTGIGMSESQMDRLFDAFVQADTSTTRRFGGTGLGLQISKRLVEMLGGSIKVKSTIGKGSVFVVRLDVGDIGNANMIQPDEISQEIEKVSVKEVPEKPSESKSKGPLHGLTILLAEDGPDNRRLISFHLKRAGAEVRAYENGKLALEALTGDGTVDGDLVTELPIDIIVTDMQMPEMDGYTLAQSLREKGCRLPIIALTAHAMEGDRQRCLDAGCDEYATKPIDAKKLISLCRGLLKAAASAM